MISKKIVMGLVGLLALALVGGSAYILLKPDERSVAQRDFAYSQTTRTEPIGGSREGVKNHGSVAGEQRREGSGGAGGLGQGHRQSDEAYGQEPAEHSSNTWATLRGSMMTLEGDTLIVRTGDGSVAVHLGPEWYWKTEGIPIQNGDDVEVTGRYEGETFKAASVENLTTPGLASLRDESGRPLWAGRGGGGQGGNQQG